MVGMTTVARLHANEAFMAQLEKAKAEYATMTGVSARKYIPQPSDASYYNLQGVKVEEGSLENNTIYIQNGQKHIMK